jgi:hypothetical protein
MDISCWLSWYVVFFKRYDNIVRDRNHTKYYSVRVFAVIYRGKLLPSAVSFCDLAGAKALVFEFE